MSWMPPSELTLQWNADLDDAWLQAHAAHGAPCKQSIAGYLELLPDKSDHQIYGRNKYWGSIGLPKISQDEACYTALRELPRSTKECKKRASPGASTEAEPKPDASTETETAQKTHENGEASSGQLAQTKHKTGRFTDEEDDEYLALLNDYGQPTKGNALALRKFTSAFPERKESSITSHINAFAQVERDDGEHHWVKSSGPSNETEQAASRDEGSTKTPCTTSRDEGSTKSLCKTRAQKKRKECDASTKTPVTVHKRVQFTSEEDEEYLALLNEFGQPTKGNPLALSKFASAFPTRKESSIKSRISTFEHLESEDGKHRWVNSPHTSTKTEPAAIPEASTETPAQTKHKTGKFTHKEEDEYLTLLNEYGQPTRANALALRKFASAFPERKESSITSHIHAFEYIQVEDVFGEGVQHEWEKKEKDKSRAELAY